MRRCVGALVRLIVRRTELALILERPAQHLTNFDQLIENMLRNLGPDVSLRSKIQMLNQVTQRSECRSIWLVR